MPVIANLFDKKESDTSITTIETPSVKTVSPRVITDLFKETKITSPKFSFLQESFIKPIKTFYGGTLKASANLADILDFYTNKITEKIGKPELKPKIFEYLRDNWATTGEQLQKEGVTNKFMKSLYSGLGQAAFDVPVLMAGGTVLKGATLPVAGAVSGFREGGVKGAVIGGVSGAAMGGVLKGLQALPTPIRLPTAFGVGAVTTPGGLEEKVAGGGVFTGLSLGGRSPTMREFKETQAKYSPLVKGYQKILPFETREGIYQNFVNRMQSIENIVEKAKNLGAKILPGENPALRARTYLGIGRKVQTVLENKTYKINPDGTFTITGEGLKPILDNYNKISLEKNRIVRDKDLTNYLIARRTIEDLQRPKGEWTTEQIVTPEQVKTAQNTINVLGKKYGANIVSLDQTATRLYDYQKRVLSTLVDSGNLSQEQYNVILAKNPHYVPFDRVLEGIEPTGGTPISKKRFTEARAPVKRIKGSELEIYNPIESMIKNTYRIMDIAERNTVARGVAKLGKVLPEDISPVKVRMQPIKVSPSEINIITKEFKNVQKEIIESTTSGKNISAPVAKLEKIVKEALQLRGIKEGEASVYIERIRNSPSTDAIKITREIIKETSALIATPQETTIFRPSQFKPKGNVIEYFDNGKRKYIEVTPNLYQAMTGLNETSTSLLIKVMSIPAGTLRVGATITPEFMLRNPIRDQWTAFIQTKLGFKPFVDTSGAIADIMGKSEAYNDWLRSGGAYSGFVELSRPNLQKMLKDLQGRPNLLKELNIISKAQDISQLFEQATRLGVYKAGIKKGLTPVEAGFESREATVDFARRGAKTKDINSVIAFFNAGIQGTDKLVRTAKEDPVGFAAKGIASITIPSVITYMLNRDDPEYKELPRWQKDLFWIFKVKDTFVRIPKPFAYGQFFGSLPERFFEYVDTQDPKAFEGLKKSLYDSLLPTSGDPAGGLMATGVKPLIENTSNWSFFLERQIVPEGKQKLLPAQQYGRYTSEGAKYISKVLNYSPSKIENLVQGWFGGTGRYALETGDIGIKTFKKFIGQSIEPERPTELADIPLIKGFVTRPALSQSESVNQFYKNRDKITQSYSTIKKYLQEGKKEEAVKLQSRYPEYRFYSGVNGTAKMLSDLRSYEDIIIKSSKSENEKRALLEKIDRQMVEVARKANEMIERPKRFEGKKKSLIVPNLF